METKVSVVGCVKERQEKLIQLKKGKKWKCCKRFLVTVHSAL